MKENLNRAENGDELGECMDLEATHHLRTMLTEDHRELLPPSRKSASRPSAANNAPTVPWRKRRAARSLELWRRIGPQPTENSLGFVLSPVSRSSRSPTPRRGGGGEW